MGGMAKAAMVALGLGGRDQEPMWLSAATAILKPVKAIRKTARFPLANLRIRCFDRIKRDSCPLSICSLGDEEGTLRICLGGSEVHLRRSHPNPQNVATVSDDRLLLSALRIPIAEARNFGSTDVHVPTNGNRVGVLQRELMEHACSRAHIIGPTFRPLSLCQGHAAFALLVKACPPIHS